ncbi:hypothetical protein B0H10DRAFT_2244537 [Mycena sp. CBHHK59/15]|nr:hypothetical protein B0H10DRAFT_2244537 [Mycena sp. CBHHK59/15]
MSLSMQALWERITAQTRAPGADSAVPVDPNILSGSIIPQRRRHDDDDDDNGTPSMPGGPDGPQNHEFLDTMFTLETGRAYKKHKRLSAQSDATVEEFLKSNNPWMHQLIVLTTSLQCLDALRNMSHDEEATKWVIPSTVKKTVTDYARVAVLSPSARCYRGKSLATAVMAAMRERLVTDLQPASETGRCEVVSDFIGTVLTQTRHSIKAVLLDSITKKTDIANVTHTCISKSKTVITVGLYCRMAWLCHQLVEQMLKRPDRDILVPATGKEKPADKESFWVNVDTALNELHDEFPDKGVGGLLRDGSGETTLHPSTTSWMHALHLQTLWTRPGDSLLLWAPSVLCLTEYQTDTIFQTMSSHCRSAAYTLMHQGVMETAVWGTAGGVCDLQDFLQI